MPGFKIFSFVALMAIVGRTQAQVISYGNCPYVSVVPNFDVSQYLGTWYEFAKYPASFQGNGVCIKAEYSQLMDGNIGVRNSQINGTTGEPGGVVGSASIVSNGKLLVQFPRSPPSDVSSNYWVLGTDYTSYAVVYSCQDLPNNQYSTIAYILTRQRLPPQSAVVSAANVLRRNYISLAPLTRTNQRNCNN